MKTFISFTIIILLSFIYLSFGGCDKRSEKRKLMFPIFIKISKKFEDEHRLKQVAFFEEGMKKYNYVGLEFTSNRVLSKAEGRKFLIEAVEELKNEINSTPKLLPYLDPSPFTYDNIDIVIFDYNDDGSSIFYPNITVFNAFKGKILYKTKIPEKPYGYYTVEEESYEDALKIVNAERGIDP